MIEQIRALDGDLRLRDLHVADLPQLPGRGAGAEPDGGAEPAHPPRRDRRRAVPGTRSRQRQIMAVPTVFLNGQPFGSGRMELDEILAKVDTGAAERDAGAARRQGRLRRADRRRRPGRRRGRGVRRAQGHPHRRRRRALRRPDAGHAGHRELHLGARRPKGPKFAAALEEHVRAYDVDIMNRQRARPALRAGRRRSRVDAGQRRRAEEPQRGARHRRALAQRRTCPARPSTATRAWPTARTATARCSRASSVAVIGGGNSGVEAAIDLAGIVAPRDAGRVRRRS